MSHLRRVAEVLQEPSTDLVVWSGGADSTLVLARLADGAVRPVRALALSAHPQLLPDQLVGQRAARQAFAAVAKKRGWSLRVAEVSYKVVGSANVSAALPQATVWLYSLLPYVADGDRVHMGYIRGDDFWHVREAFERAFRAGCKLKGVRAELVYDLEYASKLDVVRGLREARVPAASVWTCDNPIRTRRGVGQCGRCGKCRELQAACLALDAERKAPLRVLGPGRRVEAKPAKFRW